MLKNYHCAPVWAIFQHVQSFPALQVSCNRVKKLFQHCATKDEVIDEHKIRHHREAHSILVERESSLINRTAEWIKCDKSAPKATPVGEKKKQTESTLHSLHIEISCGAVICTHLERQTSFIVRMQKFAYLLVKTKLVAVLSQESGVGQEEEGVLIVTSRVCSL